MDDRILYALAIIVALLLIYNIWFRPEYLTDDEIAQSLIANAMISDPQDSTAVILQMPPAERRKYERFVGLPYDPNYYKESKERFEGLPYDPKYYRERFEGLPYDPNYYREHIENKGKSMVANTDDKFVMALYA